VAVKSSSTGGPPPKPRNILEYIAQKRELQVELALDMAERPLADQWQSALIHGQWQGREEILKELDALTKPQNEDE
jgi:hypothetical protein